MSKRQWAVIIISLVALFAYGDYAQYNTDIKTLSIMAEWSEEELRGRIPYKPFVRFDILKEHLILPW